MDAIKLIIGTITLTAARDVARSQEYAGWHETVRVAPGTYPLVAYVAWSDGAQRVMAVYGEYTGTVVSAWYGNKERSAAMVGTTTDIGERLAGREGTTAISEGGEVRGAHAGELAGVALDPRVVTVEGGRVRPAGKVVRLVTSHPGATVPGVVEGTLDRAGQIAAVKAALDRHAAASHAGWAKHDAAKDVVTAISLVTEADVRARALAAATLAGIEVRA